MGVPAVRGGLIVIVDSPFLSAALLAGYLFQINTKFSDPSQTPAVSAGRAISCSAHCTWQIPFDAWGLRMMACLRIPSGAHQSPLEENPFLPAANQPFPNLSSRRRRTVPDGR